MKRLCNLLLLSLLFAACQPREVLVEVHDTLYLTHHSSLITHHCPPGFCLLTDSVPDALLEMRYYSTYNFVGQRIEGYNAPLAYLTCEAASVLRQVSDDLRAQGYCLKIFDAYRPQQAVDHFQRWCNDLGDTAMRSIFYPEIPKSRIRPDGYLATHSGHSRGSTVDLTLVDLRTGQELDMGSPFDYFGPLSHPDYPHLTPDQRANRQLLRQAMLRHGFKPNPCEWWHYTLRNEPYPNTYFNFPIQ